MKAIRKPRKGRKIETVPIGNIKVKIYRREKVHKSKDDQGREVLTAYTVFEVADYTAGVRRLRSFSNHDKARAEAKKIGNQLATGNATAALMSNSDAASFGRSMELLRPTAIGDGKPVSLEYAAATFAKCFEILGGDRMVEAARFFDRHGAGNLISKTVPEVVTELVTAKRNGKMSPRYIGDLSARLTKFAESNSGEIGNVTTGDVQRWLDGLNVAPQTAKNFRTVLHTLFQFAEARGYIFKDGNPVAGVEKPKANGGAIEIYSAEEIGKLLKAAPEDFRAVIALGAFAGLRTAEIERLHFEDIGTDFITVAADKAKTRSRRLVPVLPALNAWLALTPRRGKVWTRTTNDLQNVRAQTVKAAEVPWKDNAARHSFISYRLADTQDAAKVALEAGNSPTVIFKHYRELVKPEAAKAWFAVMPDKGPA